MTDDLLSSLDFTRSAEPDPGPITRDLLVDWLRYQRHEFLRKIRDLTPEQIVQWSVEPLELSVLGLVRHMQQMEHVYLAWGLGGGERRMLYGEDDYAGGSVETIEEDLALYLAEIERSDSAIGAIESLDEVGLGHGRPLGATLIKMIHEYTLHSGQAHMLRFAALGEIVR